MRIKYLILAFGLLLFASCSKESNPVASENLNIPSKFEPGANEPAEVHKMFNEHGLWIRMDFTNYKEVTTTPLASDPSCRGVIKIKDEDRASAIKYSETLLSNVSKEYAKKFFPLELFFVNTYGTSWWIYSFQQLGRCRLVIEWPNKYKGTITMTDPSEHYYQDSVLTNQVWTYLGNMVSSRIEPITKFITAGKAYDNGEAYDNILSQYENEEDLEKRNAALDELCISGGYITASGSRNFGSDFSSWFKLLATESYDNIKSKYLDNSPKRLAKYNELINYFNNEKWDIQAAGDKFRERFNAYKATLPPPPPVEEE